MSKIIGIGKGAGEILSLLQNLGCKASSALIGTDRKHLEQFDLEPKLLIGQDSLKGLGTNGDLKKGRRALRTSMMSVSKLLEQGEDLLILIACLGGGTGSGGVIELAKAAKNRGKTVLCATSLPFSFEGPQKHQNAKNAINELRQLCGLFIFPNDRISSTYGNLSMKEAMEKARFQLATCAKDLYELYTAAEHRPKSLADFHNFLGAPGRRFASSTELEEGEESPQALERLLSTDLFPGCGLAGAEHALVKLSAGQSGVSHAEVSNLWMALNHRLGHERFMVGVTTAGNKAPASLTICSGGYKAAQLR